MAIKFLCDSCGKKLGVDDRLAGRRGKCPDCGFLFTVPAPDAPPPPPPRAMRQDATDYHVAVEGPDADLLFGRLAVKAGYLSEEQVQGLLGSQARAAAAGAPVSLGEICQSRRLLTSSQVQSLLLAQQFALLRAEDKRLGQLAVRNGFATEDDVRAALDEQKRAYGTSKALPLRLGEILVEMGTLSEQQLRALLSAQARLAGTARPMLASKEEAATGWLVQEAGDGAGSRFRLGKKVVLGRQPENEVPIEDDQASRQHARIEFIPLAHQHVLMDMNSRNGTCVNGEPVTEPVALADGDRIQIGETVLLYRAGAVVAVAGVSPDETRAAPPVRMGSQLRRETATMRAATQRDAVDGPIRPVAAPESEVEEDCRPASEPDGAPRRAAARISRRAALAGSILVLSVGIGTWILASRGERGAAPIVAMGTESQNAQVASAVPHASEDSSVSAGTSGDTPVALSTIPPTTTTAVATAPRQEPPPEADHARSVDPRLEAQREARAKIERARVCIASRDFEGAQALLQEALSLDPDSESEIVPLFEAADQGLNQGKTATAAATTEETPAEPAPASPSAEPNPKQPAPGLGRPTDDAAAPLLAAARAHERNSKFDLAIPKYREILADYPDTAAAGTAKERLAALRLSCSKCQGLGMKCPSCNGKGTTYTTCAVCNGAGKGAGSMQAGKAGKMQNAMCSRCNGSCKHDEMCRKCGGEGRVRCSVCWALPALEGSPSSQRRKKEPELLDDWNQNLALMVSGREGWTGADYAAMEKELRAKRAGAGESPAAIADSLGAALMAQGKFKEASDCFAKSLSLRKEALGKDAPEVGDCLLDFGVLDAAQGKTAAALLNLDQAHLLYMTAWNAARNKEFFLLVWGAATENQPEGLAKDAMEVAQSEGRRQVKEEIDSIAARMDRANLLRDLIETCELRWRFKSSAGTGQDAPPRDSEGDEAKARALLGTAEQFSKNGLKDRAIEELNEIVDKYPRTEAAAKAQERLADLQQAAGPGTPDGAGKTTDEPPKGDSGAGHNATDKDEAEACPTCGGRGTVPCTACTDGKVSGDCPTCLGTGSPSAREPEWRGHMDAGTEAFNAIDFHRAEREWRAALSIAETFGEHDLRLMKTLGYLATLLEHPGMQKSEGEAMIKRAQEIAGWINKNGVPEEKKCAKCKGTGTITTACPDCKGKRVAPCPDCRGKRPSGGSGAADDERANSLLTVAQAFETNKKPDLAIQKYEEILSKYPDTEAAATAKKRLEELQAGGGSDK